MNTGNAMSAFTPSIHRTHSFLKGRLVLKMVPPRILNSARVVCMPSIDGVNVHTTMLYSCTEFPVFCS